MEFYYEKEISSLEVKCPPEDYEGIERESFRWVFDSMNDPRNFQSQAEKNPKVLNDKSDVKICMYYALSFHVSEQASEKHYSYLKRKFGGKIAIRLGTHIAKGKLEKSNGVASEPDSIGHFSLHPAKNHTLKNKFQIIRELSNEKN